MKQKDQRAHWPKFQHVFPTFAVVAVLTITGLVLVRWIIIKLLPGIEIKEEVWELWLPFIAPIFPVAIWLRPKLKILRFKKRTGDRRFLILCVAAVAIAITSMMTQAYVLRAMSELHELVSIEDIDAANPERYYRIAEFDISHIFAAAHADVRASGKRSETLNFDFFFVFPMMELGKGVLPDHRYWYGIKYHYQIDNKQSVEEKERMYEVSYNDAVKSIESHDFHAQEYLEQVPESDDRDNYRMAVLNRFADMPAENRLVVLIAGDGAFEERTGDKLSWIFQSAGIGAVIFLLILAWPIYSRAELQRQQAGKMPEDNPFDGIKKFLVPRDDYFAAPILLNAIVLVFLLLTYAGVHPLNPTGTELLEWGANRRSETMGGQWWRLVSSMFLHGGIMHLILNVFGLMLAAVFVEVVYGRYRLFAIYFIAGICGSLASIWWYENTVSVGASGAIFGLFGAVAALVPFGRMKPKFLAWIGVFVGLSLLMGLGGGIDNAAHIGGLLSGALIGVLFQLAGKLEINKP